jgi:hypothetical protein
MIMTQTSPAENAPADIVSVKVPFSGLYNSIHDAMIDMAMEQINTNDAGEEVTVIEVGNVRWAEVQLAYVQAWMKEAVKESGIPMTFQKMISPRDYSMGNDEIVAGVPQTVLEDAFNSMDDAKKDEWRKLVEDALTERPGFLPYSQYSKDADEWGSVVEWDDAQRDLFFHFYAAPLIEESFHAERASEMLDEAIWSAVIDPDQVPGHVDNSNESSLEV